jgi:VWFA-related protein
VTGLKKEDFVVVEDHELQNIDVFETWTSNEPSRTMVLIIGKSFDMPDIKANIEAAKLLVDDLRTSDKMAIVTTDLTLRTDFTNDKLLLKRSLDAIPKIRGWIGAMTFATLMAVINEKFGQNDRHRMIVLQGAISDIPLVVTGDDSLWNSLGKAQQTLKRHIVFTDIEEAVERSNVTVYSFITTPKLRAGWEKDEAKIGSAILQAYGRMEYEFFQAYYPQIALNRDTFISRLERRDNKHFFQWVSEHQKSMTRLATISGGTTSYVEKSADAEAAYRNVAEISRSRYTIGYSPKDQKSPSRLRSISIIVKNHPEYVVSSRTTYFR